MDNNNCFNDLSSSIKPSENVILSCNSIFSLLAVFCAVLLF